MCHELPTKKRSWRGVGGAATTSQMSAKIVRAHHHPRRFSDKGTIIRRPGKDTIPSHHIATRKLYPALLKTEKINHTLLQSANLTLKILDTHLHACYTEKNNY